MVHSDVTVHTCDYVSCMHVCTYEHKYVCVYTPQVSIAAIKSFHIVVDPQPTSCVMDLTTTIPTDDTSTPPSVWGGPTNNAQLAVWCRTWQAWESIGTLMVTQALPGEDKLCTAIQSQDESKRILLNRLPTQAFLSHFLEVFPYVFFHLKPNFTDQNLQVLCQILTSALLMPATKDVSPFLVPSSNENLMTSVQKLILRSLAIVFTEQDIFEPRKEPVEGALLTKRKSDHIDMTKLIELNCESDLAELYPTIMLQLLDFFLFATKQSGLLTITSGVPPMKLPIMVINVIPFSVGALKVAVKLYRACVTESIPLPENIPELFLKVSVGMTCLLVHMAW